MNDSFLSGSNFYFFYFIRYFLSILQVNENYLCY